MNITTHEAIALHSDEMSLVYLKRKRDYVTFAALERMPSDRLTNPGAVFGYTISIAHAKTALNAYNMGDRHPWFDYLSGKLPGTGPAGLLTAVRMLVDPGAYDTGDAEVLVVDDTGDCTAYTIFRFIMEDNDPWMDRPYSVPLDPVTVLGGHWYMDFVKPHIFVGDGRVYSSIPRPNLYTVMMMIGAQRWAPGESADTFVEGWRRFMNNRTSAEYIDSLYQEIGLDWGK